jgi:putative ABC transport system permease protein
MLNGLQSAIVSGFTESQSGDVQLHNPEYLEANEALPLDKSFQINDDFRKMMSEVPEIRAYSGRIEFSGMISNGEDTTLFIGFGIDPDNEYKVCPRNKRNIFEGGQPIRDDIPRGVVIGKGLAQALNAHVGSELTLLVTTRLGGLNGMDVTVSGIAEFKLPGIGNKIVHIPLPAAQKLLYMQDQVTEVVADVNDMDAVERVDQHLASLLKGPYSSLNLVPNTWMDVGQFYVSANEISGDATNVLGVLLYLIAYSYGADEEVPEDGILSRWAFCRIEARETVPKGAVSITKEAMRYLKKERAYQKKGEFERWKSYVGW